MRPDGIAFANTVAILLWLGPQVVPAQETIADPLALRVRSYSVQGASIIEALQSLKASVEGNGLVVSLEVAPFEQEPEKNLTLSVINGTVKQALDRIIGLDRRYAYSIFLGKVVHVFPYDAKEDAHDLLNVKVKGFAVSETSYDRLLQYPNNYIAELGAELARRGKSGGVAGSMMYSMDVPKVRVTVEDGTVRDILNQISLEAAKASKSDVAPTGWVYTFRKDKSTPLGGLPRWQIF